MLTRLMIWILLMGVFRFMFHTGVGVVSASPNHGERFGSRLLSILDVHFRLQLVDWSPFYALLRFPHPSACLSVAWKHGTRIGRSISSLTWPD